MLEPPPYSPRAPAAPPRAFFRSDADRFDWRPPPSVGRLRLPPPLRPAPPAAQRAHVNGLPRRSAERPRHVQGQAVPSADAAARLAPSDDAFNLREDMEAARFVFEALQDHVPFTLLGKHAAYRNGLTCEDFRSWSALVKSGAVDLFEMAKDQMNGFRTAARCDGGDGSDGGGAGGVASPTSAGPTKSSWLSPRNSYKVCALLFERGEFLQSLRAARFGHGARVERSALAVDGDLEGGEASGEVHMRGAHRNRRVGHTQE